MRNKRRYRITESGLRGIMRSVVRRVLMEGSQQMRYNDEGEPIGFEYVPDQYEQEEMDWEERMRRHDDPMYAASQEAQEWYQKACRAFESQGVRVPEDVIEALAREMRRKARKAAYDAAMAKMEPLADAVRKMGYDAEPRYESETPEEEAYYYVEVTKDGKSISRDELHKLQDTLGNKGFDDAWDILDTY